MVTIRSGAPVEVWGKTVTTAGSGGAGGAGGNSGNDADLANNVAGGAGGAAGAGGKAGNAELFFDAETAAFHGAVSLAAGDAGNGGDGGKAYSLARPSGNGGKGGDGGNMIFTVKNDMLLHADLIEIKSGAGGDKGADGAQKTPGALQGLGGAGGAAGYAEFTVDRDLVVLQDDARFKFTKGPDGNGSAGGVFRVDVKRNLEVSAGKHLALEMTGNFKPADSIRFNTLYLKADSSFVTTATLYTGDGDKPGSGQFYQVRNLDLVKSAVWRTDGKFAPDSHNAPHDYTRFDMTDVFSSALMLDFNGPGTVSLAKLDPRVQQEKYLGNPDRPRYADDPKYRSYDGYFVSNSAIAPAFITSAYQTKRLHLGNVILVNKTQGDPPSGIVESDAAGNLHYKYPASALGELYDDFAYTAGLRRYYFDVYVDAGVDRALVAHNHHTADASKVYAQSAASAAVSVNQTFQTALSAMEQAFANLAPDKASVDFVMGGSGVKVDTGSHVRVATFSSALSLAKKIEHKAGVSALGVFAEFGVGGYDTFAYIPRYGDISGEGDVRTFGGGIYLKTVFDSGTFFSASVRGGGVRNDYSVTKDPWIRRPEVHSAVTTNAYFGAHAELGQKIKISENSELEGYGQYLWTHTPKDNFTTRFGDRVSIDSFDSSRVRVGARVKTKIKEGDLELYCGLAAERELAGGLSGSLNEDKFTHKVDTKGTSGYGELGMSFKPAKNVSVSIGAFGWAGQTRGGGVTVGLSINF
ncbi:MAG: autotransporter outer membrane beta-barrel domain-containing protein [Deltaproteobacteria bacterium]|nr:autotransporter outer membrane beta-barrel domain-containing protein [Deltaproteobacteria bacterium]